MKSEHAPKRARSAAAALIALALAMTGCFAMGAAAANDTQAQPPPKREAPPIPAPGLLQDEALEKQLVDRMIAKGDIVAARIIFNENDWRTTIGAVVMTALRSDSSESGPVRVSVQFTIGP
jgi:hypothetical protein